jgi:predicted AAA+ superfamily ATPase
MSYLPRVVDQELEKKLAATGAVVIEGAKACGKTETARQVAASEVLFDIDENARQAVGVDPSLVLEGDTPRLLDEWQLEPEIWDHVRRAVDASSSPGQFILTGSAVPSDDATRHTGAMRITRLRMRPMSLYEADKSLGRISLAELLAGEEARSADPGLNVEELAREITVGGWPALRSLETSAAMEAVRGYIDEIRRADVSRVDGTRRDPNRVGRLLQSLARNVATPAAISTLARDTAEFGEPVNRDTVSDYLDVLTRLMIVEDQPAWATHLRSRYVLRNAPRRHFVDPSLAVAALRATPKRLLQDLKLFGFLFESLVVRDLRIYAQAADAQVLQYHDSDGLEVDAIVQAAAGPWAAFEVKLGTGQVDAAAANLIKFAKRIDTEKSGEPAALGVIVGTGYGYTRDDGVMVIPIGALRP